MRVLYPGGFDCFHHGHVNALKAVKSLGYLMVGVNSDRLMKHYKRVPAQPETHRVKAVLRQGIADEVFIWDGPEGQADQILAHDPDVYVAGTDWLSKDLAKQLDIPHLAWFDQQRISLLYLRRTQGISTTQIIKALDHGEG